MRSAREDKQETLSKFGAGLRRALLAAGMSQDDPAHRFALHVTDSRLERGVRDPRLTTIIEVAHGSGIPASDLLVDQ